MGLKVFLIAVSLLISAMLSTQESFAKNSASDDSATKLKKVDIFN